MAMELVSGMKMQDIQRAFPGLESDAIADFSFIFGDMNYRLNTDFASLNNSNMSNAVGMIPTHDQLTLARKEKNYPGYEEAEITF